MNKQFGTMKTNIGTMIGDTSTDTATNIGVWINNRYNDIISRYDWDELFYTHTISASANQAEYSLPANIEKVIYIVDEDNDAYIEEMSEQAWIMEHFDSSTITGCIQHYVLKRDVVKAQPSSATKPVAKSSSASDNTQSLVIRGIVSGAEVVETLALNGLTAVTASNSYERILALSKTASTAGTVTIYENDATTVLSVMSPEAMESRYSIVKFHHIPETSYVLNARLKRKVLPLSSAYDYPVIDCGEVIELGAIADAWRAKRQFAKAGEMERLYEQGLDRLIFNRVKTPNEIIHFGVTPYSREDGI